MYPNFVMKVANTSKYDNALEEEYLQVDRNAKLSDYYALLNRTSATFRMNFQKDNCVRIWKCPQSANPYQALHQQIRKQCQDLEYNEDVEFDFEGDYLDPKKYDTVEEVGISPDDLIIVEFKDVYKPWVLKNP